MRPTFPRPTPSHPLLATRPGVLVAGLAALVVGLTWLVPLAPASAAPWDTVVRMSVVKDTRIKENSGMSRSTYQRRVLFVHNDSGGGPRFFAIGPGGRTKAVFDVPGAPAKDWEDMASGPKHTLWFGDIGGNRSEVNVVRVKEPRKLAKRKLAHTSYVLTYPDGAHNAESLMVHPKTGRVYVITKASGGAAIYRAPRTLDAAHDNAMRKVADAPRGLSGADFAKGGKRFVLRHYHAAEVFRAIGGHGYRFPLPDAHTFGEAVTFGRGGALVFGAEGVNQWLWKATH